MFFIQKGDEQRIFKAFRRVLANAIVMKKVQAAIPASQNCVVTH